jgi:hypothetical protein
MTRVNHEIVATLALNRKRDEVVNRPLGASDSAVEHRDSKG